LDNDETEKFNKSADAVRSMNDALNKILWNINNPKDL
jgi:hypothetical protein